MYIEQHGHDVCAQFNFVNAQNFSQMLTYEDTDHLKIKDEIQLLGYFVDITNCNDWFKIWKREVASDMTICIY